MCTIFINMFPLWTSFYRLRLATVSPRVSARAEMSGAFLRVFQNKVPLNSLGYLGGPPHLTHSPPTPVVPKGDHQSCLHCRSLHLRPKLKQEPKLLHFAKFRANQTILTMHTIVVASARW